MTCAPLQGAMRRGYHVGALQSTAMGRPVYQRIGFQENCLLSKYAWQPPAPTLDI
jgi:hypothetical protein